MELVLNKTLNTQNLALRMVELFTDCWLCRKSLLLYHYFLETSTKFLLLLTSFVIFLF